MDRRNASRISNLLRLLPPLAALAGALWALGSVGRMDLEPPIQNVLAIVASGCVSYLAAWVPIAAVVVWLRRRRLRSLIVAALSDRDLEAGQLLSTVAASEVDDGHLLAHYLAGISSFRRRGLIHARPGQTTDDEAIYSLAHSPHR